MDIDKASYDTEWAVQSRTFTDGPYDRTDDGTAWSDRRGQKYTENEARAVAASYSRRGQAARVVRRSVTPWEETD